MYFLNDFFSMICFVGILFIIFDMWLVQFIVLIQVFLVSNKVIEILYYSDFIYLLVINFVYLF